MRSRLPASRPLFYYITDRRQFAGAAPEAAVRRAIRCEVDLIQIREKDLADRDLYALVLRAVRLSRGSRSRILVNGRADVALAAGAHGVHLPSRGLAPGDLRPHVPARFIIGVSVHSLEEALVAARRGADYVLLGPIFPTASKLRYGPPLGLEYLGRTCRRLRAPVIALGGIDPRRIDPALRAGAAGVAGISLFQRHLVREDTLRREIRLRKDKKLDTFRPMPDH